MLEPVADTEDLALKSPAVPGDIKKMIRRAAIYFVASILLLAVGFAVLSVLKDGHRIMASLQSLPIWAVAAVIGFALFNYAVRAWRFKYYAQCLSLHTSYSEILVYYVAGFAMSMSPGKLGEVARLWFLKRRYGFSYHKGLALQIADRASDVYAALILSLIGMIHFEQYRFVVLVMMAVVIVAMALLIWPGQILKLIRTIYGVVKTRPRLFVRLQHMINYLSFTFRPDILTFSLALALMGWLAECFALYLLLFALGTPISLLSTIFIFSFSNIAGGLTMLPGGIGGVELTMVALLSLNNVPTDAATAATVVVRICTLWLGVTLGFLDLPIAIKMSASGWIPPVAPKPVVS
jgi:glycosyltransferase 2 family protein